MRTLVVLAAVAAALLAGCRNGDGGKDKQIAMLEDDLAAAQAELRAVEARRNGALFSHDWPYFVAVDNLRRGRVNPIDDLGQTGPDRVTHSDVRIVIDDSDDDYDVTLVNTGAAVPPRGRWSGQIHDAMDGSVTDVAWVYTDSAGRSERTTYLSFGWWVRHDLDNLSFTVDVLSGAVGETIGAPVESGPWVAIATLAADFGAAGSRAGSRTSWPARTPTRATGRSNCPPVHSPTQAPALWAGWAT